MADCFVIMYGVHDGDYSSDQVATVCRTLPGAIDWITKTYMKDKCPNKYLTGTDLRYRAVFNFTVNDWTSYYIQRSILED